VRSNQILKLQPNDRIKCGILNIGFSDQSWVVEARPNSGVRLCLGKLEEIVKVVQYNSCDCCIVQ
jgi:hypothetical protein